VNCVPELMIPISPVHSNSMLIGGLCRELLRINCRQVHAGDFHVSHCHMSGSVVERGVVDNVMGRETGSSPLGACPRLDVLGIPSRDVSGETRGR
jgi:hypothetical protein